MCMKIFLNNVHSLIFFAQARGASVGDIFIASDCAFHDRRIPIPVSVVLFLLGSSFVLLSSVFSAGNVID